MSEIFDTICDAINENLGDIVRIQRIKDCVIVRPKDTTIPAFFLSFEELNELYPALKQKPGLLRKMLLARKPKEIGEPAPLTPEEEEEMDCEFGAYSWPNPYGYESDWDDDD